MARLAKYSFFSAQFPSRAVQHKRRIALTACILSVLFTSTGCLHIPAESIKLNQTVKANMIDFRQKHIALAHTYFRAKREQFDDWFLRAYEPRYLENYKKVFQQKNGVPFDLSKSEHRSLYVQDSIAEHDELIAQIGIVESDLVKALDEGYGNLLAANEAVTALLQSSKNLTDAQKQFYDQTIGKLIPPLEADKVDAKIRDLQAKALQAVGGQ
jgi:hypothetical protein